MQTSQPAATAALRRLLLAATVLTVPLAPAPARADMDLRRLSVPQADAPPAKAMVFQFKPQSYRLQVMPAGALKTTAMRQGVGVAVKDADQLPAIASLMRRETLVVNGGFSAGSTDIPVGLLITHGKAASGPNFNMLPAVPQASCPLLAQPRLQHAGVLCVQADGSLSIGRVDKIGYEQCVHAIQAGPLLVEDGQTAVCAEAGKAARHARTVVCVGSGWAQVVISEPVALHDLAAALATDQGPGGALCTQAINLSGDTSSGALYAYPGSKFRAPRLEGRGAFPVPSLLVISRL